MSKIIAIDCDVTKSGYAECDNEGLRLFNYTLWEIFDELEQYINDDSVMVIIEAGWLQKNRSYHGGGKGSAYDVGRNSEIGRQIEKYCIAFGIKHQLVKPVGYSGYTHEKFCLVTGYNGGRTNGETRVAGLFAYHAYQIEMLKNRGNGANSKRKL